MGGFITAGTLPLVILVVFFSETYIFSVLLCVFYSVLSMTAESSFGALPKVMCWLMPIPLTTLWSAGNLTVHGTMDGVGMLIPTTFQTIIILAVIALLSLFLGLVSATFMVIADLMMGFPGISVTSVLQTFIQIILNCLFLYIAVMPVIVFAVRIPNGHMIGTIIAFVYGYGGMLASGNATLANIYPVTASLGLISYRSYDSAVFIFPAKGNVPVKKAKRRKRL